PLPLHRPVTERLARRLEPALAQLTRIRIEHHRLKHRLVDIESCVQHLPGPPFLTEVGPRTYRGSWRPPPLHPHASVEPRWPRRKGAPAASSSARSFCACSEGRP